MKELNTFRQYLTEGELQEKKEFYDDDLEKA